MYEFWYNSVKRKFGKKAKLCFINTCSFIVYIQTDDIYKDIVADTETKFNISNYGLERPLAKGKKIN